MLFLDIWQPWFLTTSNWGGMQYIEFKSCRQRSKIYLPHIRAKQSTKRYSKMQEGISVQNLFLCAFKMNLCPQSQVTLTFKIIFIFINPYVIHGVSVHGVQIAIAVLQVWILARRPCSLAALASTSRPGLGTSAHFIYIFYGVTSCLFHVL